jgi:hypothetical protein
MSNTINMRDFGLKMIAGVAIAGTVTIAMGTSAQAAVIGRLEFSGNADLNTASIDFADIGSLVSNGGSPGGFSPTGTIPSFFAGVSSVSPLSVGSIQDLTSFGTMALPTLPTAIANFINFNTDPNLTATQKAKLSFKLTDFFQSTATVYKFKGVFGDGTLGQGQIGTTDDISPLNNALGVRAYAGSLEAVAVPTPALLPGLIGIGMAAMRKRQSKTATA